MELPLPVPDQELLKLLCGPPGDVDAALTILWTHTSHRLAAYALSILPPAMMGDCQDVVSEVFVKLLAQPTKFAQSLNGSIAGWLITVVRNVALDRCRKSEVRERHLNDPSTADALRPQEAPRPDQQMQRHELLQQRRAQLAQLYLELGDAAAQMGEKQQSVALLMLKLFQETAGWPTAGRLHEALICQEPTLKPDTVKERRKEVMAKFNIILQNHGRHSIPD